MNPLSPENPFGVDRLNDVGCFRPDLDVISIGAPISRTLSAEIEAVRNANQPEAKRKIQVLLGQPGYGKTHLFGRLLHEMKESVVLVSVPQANNTRAPDANVQWRLVEVLFQPDTSGVSTLNRLFARLLRPSFEAYLNKLPAQLQAQHAALLQRIEDEEGDLLRIFTAVSSLSPFHALAESLLKRFTTLPAAPVRAMVLGLSQAAGEARRWLRGETLSEEQSSALRLPEQPPTPTEVLQVVAFILGELKIPLLLCLDQLELLIEKGSQKIVPFTSLLMGWLQEVPNLLMVVGCLRDIWMKEIQGAMTFGSFNDRAIIQELQPLTPEQAVELLRRRLKSRLDPRGEVWPFETADVKEFVKKENLVSPRGFIQLCCRLLEVSDAKKDNQPTRMMGDTVTSTPPLPILFQQEWNRQLEAIQKAGKAAVHYQEEELWEGCKQALLLAGNALPPGLTLLTWHEKALPQSPTDPRPSAEIRLGVGKEQRSVVLAVSKRDTGVAYGAYIDALEKAMGGNVVGAVVVWPAEKLGVGPKAKAFLKYQEKVAAKKVRPFALDSQEQTFHRLECLRRIINQAQTGYLQLGGKTLSVIDCRKLIIETKQLDKLKLFEFLFEGWPEIERLRTSVPALEQVGAATAPVTVNAPKGASEHPLNPTIKRLDPSRPLPPPPPPLPNGASAGAAGAQAMLDKVIENLRILGQPVKAKGVEVGPTFIRLKVDPQGRTDFAKVRRQADNLKMHLELDQRPIIEAQPGYISIDVQRSDRQSVSLAPLMKALPLKFKGQPVFPAGVDVSGHTHWINLAESSSCHLLIAGTTGSGKSEFMKAMLAGLASVLGPDQLQFLIIDPKRVTFNFPHASPYLLQPVAHELDEALPLMEECVQEMERRYVLLQQRQKTHISELSGADARPWRVLVFDEFADLMVDRADKKAMETMLKRIGAKARAAGIHLVLGTQRPEASVVTPLLRSNLPGRISLHVTSEKDSKLILDSSPEAAYLLGKGDLLFRQGGGQVRLQSPLVSTSELHAALKME